MSNNETNLQREDLSEGLIPPVAVSDEIKARILGDLTVGTLSLMDATYRLGLPDGGWTLKLLADHGLALCGLDGQAGKPISEEDQDVFFACLRPEVRAQLAMNNRGFKN